MSDEVFTNKITADVSQFEIKLESAQKEMQAFEKALKLVESVKLKDPLSPNYNAQLELANRNLAKTKQELLAAGEAAQKTKTHISGLQSAMSALSAVGIGKMLLDFAKKAQEASVWDTKLNAVLESTKGVSGMTKQSLDGLTKSLHESTGMSSNAIKEAEHMLLTFTNIGKDVFPKATESVLNLATAMGSDTKSAAIQLGKALNDPEKGITALHRVGVSFSAQQKEQIANFQKLGKTAEAQKVILAELDTEFGGLANAVGKNRNPMERMHELMENLEKSLGKVVLQIIDYLNPAFEAFKSVITALMDSPFGKSALIITGIIAALVLIGITIYASVIPAVTSAIASFIAMWEALGGPVAWVITAIVAVGAGIYLLYTNCEWFRKGVQAVWEYIQMAWNEIYAATSILVESIVNYFTTLYNVAIAIFGGWRLWISH